MRSECELGVLKHFLLGRCSSQHYDRSQQTRQHSCPNPKVLATTPPRVTCVLPQRRARMRPTPMKPVHRNTPPPPQSTQRQLGVGGRGATPGSAMSSVFASPGSPGSTGSPGGHKYGTVAQRLTYPAADELSLEPYDGTEQDEAEAGEEAAADAGLRPGQVRGKLRFYKRPDIAPSRFDFAIGGVARGKASSATQPTKATNE